MKIIFTFIFKLFVAVANFVLTPVNQAVASAFPEFTQIISGFNTFLATYITPGLRYFFFMLPPFTRNIVIYYLSLLIILYVVTVVVHFIIKVFTIIKAIKVW